MPDRGRLLGVDLGSVRIGLAQTDVGQLVATPVGTVAPEGDPVGAIETAVEEVGAAAVVVGYPRTLGGREGRAAHEARRVAEEVADRTGLPTVLWDERFTTVEAERVMLEQDASRRERRAKIDRVAATLILQAVVDARRGGAGRPGGTAWR